MTSNTKTSKETKEIPPIWFPIVPVIVLAGIGNVLFISYKVSLWLGIPFYLPIPLVLRIIFGVPLILTGGFFFLWGFKLLKPAGALGLAKKLRTSGAYAYTRNPMYFGVCSILWGVGILQGLSYVLIAALIWSAFNYFWVVIGEEKGVEAKFGEEYLEYKRRVSRFIPSFWEIWKGKNMYKWNAENHHKSSSEQQKWARELISKLGLKGSERVLDIGCGDGKVTAEIAEKLPKGSVLGIDNSEEMISFAQENFDSERYPNLTFQLMDAKEINFISEFDVVFSTATLHWVIDHLPVIKGIKRSLKPGGRILLQMAGKGNAAKILKDSETIVHSKKWQRYFTDFTFPWAFYGVDEYKVWLKDIGFKAKRIELIPKDMIHKGKEGLMGWIRTTWLPFTQRIPEEFREDFIGEIADRYIQSCPMDNEGFIHIQMVRLGV